MKLGDLLEQGLIEFESISRKLPINIGRAVSYTDGVLPPNVLPCQGQVLTKSNPESSRLEVWRGAEIRTNRYWDTAPQHCTINNGN